MNIKELFDNQSKIVIDQTVVKAVEASYKVSLSKEMQSIICATADFYNIGNRIFRKLDTDEMVNCLVNFGVDMQSHQLIPLFDIAENDFIVWDLATDQFALFNIVDEQVFFQCKSISDIFSQLSV